MNSGTEITVEEVLSDVKRNLAFYKKGGVTVTGGEPLLQTDFLISLFTALKEQGIHTCIDTSGITFNPENTEYVKKLDTLMAVTDLVMLDIKHIDAEKHKVLTGFRNENILAFAKYLEEKGIPLWVRHIIVEGYTDEKDDLEKLGEFIGELKNLKALDVLPYHTMGVSKYKELNIPYALEGIEALPLEKAKEAKQHILNGIKRVKK